MTSASPWIPVALSADIEAGTSAGTLVNGEERVVWRDDKGAIHVWEDRCPHRGMRMSFGFVRGDHIACLYHGWRYDTGGQCRYIPAHPDLEVPQTIKVPTFAATERAGIVWMAPQGADATDLSTLPKTAEPVRSLFLDLSTNAALLAVTAAPPEGYHPVPGAPGTVTLQGSEVTVLIAAQSRDAERSALHITVTGDISTTTRRSLALWATDLRNRLEARSMEAA
ncbi:Rieske (2Fe-2S) protein [Rhizobium rosettiformans]|uniref:Rieske (2Fe-2S) protein n=1 Tax=Rhizobium rosettiformans TaxID=1368430 RepID=UPI002862F894|nr:Rieske (2Fe-2S) protein [Rhizobium rosettiformans]MDR7029143.1 nitrite reductase/ring-hydroxylating ferredoxin subunit [Rhizobium rosettiformans]MDR7062857.1 nitrite reductase/ring-hydroxylating ferredoxin subunit [Rhizobium rosettiformans]